MPTNQHLKPFVVSRLQLVKGCRQALKKYVNVSVSICLASAIRSFGSFLPVRLEILFLCCFVLFVDDKRSLQAFESWISTLTE